MRLNLKTFLELLKDTATGWNKAKAPRLAAALAYYTTFSLAPLLIIVIAIAGLVFGRQAVSGQLVGQIKGLVGNSGAEVIQTAIQNASKPKEGSVASIISIVVLIFGASGVFAQLQDALNTIWEVQPKPSLGVFNLIRSRFLSFGMILGIGFLLLVSLVVSAGLAGVFSYLGNTLPILSVLLPIANFILSFLLITLLFALMYKFLPDAKIAWSDVWIGSALTALLFTIGKSLLGLYLGHGGFGSTYGAAGSLVIILAWFYYSGLILFFGAEFTKVYARKFGSRIVPDDNAEAVTAEARAEQGMQLEEEETRSNPKKKPAPNFISRLFGRSNRSKRKQRRSDR